MKPRASALSLGSILFVVVLGHLTLFPKIADLDGFYHVGHAAAYLDGSLFDTSLPWASQSIIGDRGGDMWWGFHVLLTPFAALSDVEMGVRTAAVVLTLVLAGVFLFVLRRHEIPGAGWWVTLALVAVPNVFYRHLMVRPHVLSLAAAILLLSVLVRGRWWHAGLIAAFITWTHLGLFWMAPGIVIAYAMVRVVEWVRGENDPDTLSVPVPFAISAVFLGTIAGWLLRPHPIEAGVLANVQIIRLFAQKTTEEPLLFSAELSALPVMELVRTSWLFLTAWLIVLGGLFAYRRAGRLAELPREERVLLVTSLLISSAFLLLTLVSARRAMVEWVGFGFLALPVFWTWLVGERERLMTRSVITVLLFAHFAWGARRHMLNVAEVAFRPDTMRGVAEFLETNSEPGEVAWHAHWDNFGPLLARNRTNAYLSGMDPIFMFAHEPRFYWEYFWLSADINVEWTCDAFPCAAGVVTDTHTVLRDHFAASWVVVEPFRNPRLTLYFLDDPRYEVALETEHEAVFKVLPDYPEGTEPSASGADPAADPVGTPPA